MSSPEYRQVIMFLRDRDAATIDRDYDYDWTVQVDAQGKPLVDEDGYMIDDGCEMEQMPMSSWTAQVMQWATL